MTDPGPQLRLSSEGSRRREQIGDMLANRARNRRIGMNTLATLGCTALIGVAFLGARTLFPTPTTEPIATIPTPAPTAIPTSITSRPSIEVAIVSNQPLPSQPCGELPSSNEPASNLPVCILDDAHLLRALALTGESYGIVRVGGRTQVVLNSR